MSLKNMIKKSGAIAMAISILFANYSLSGIGLLKVIAEDANTPEIIAQIENEKYVQYQYTKFVQEEEKEVGIKGVAVQSKLSISPEYNQDTYLPTEWIEIKINLPSINECLPEKASVVEAMTNSTTGEELNKNINQSYDSNSGLLTVSYENVPNEEGNIYSNYNENANDEFEIIYSYPAEAYVGDKEEIKLDYRVDTKGVFRTESGSVISENSVDIELIEKENRSNILSFGITDLKKSIYKGFIYSNVENKTEYDTEYKTVSTFCGLNSSLIDETIIMELKESEFILSDEDETKISSNGNIVYKSTSISKYEFDRILGQEGFIEIYLGEEVIATVKYVDEEGTRKLAVIYSDENIVLLKEKDTTAIIEYPENVTGLKVKLSKPIAEGFIHFENQNVIKASEDYGVNAQEIKYIFTEGTVNKVSNNTKIELKEPETKVTVNSSNINFSTLQTNKTTLTINLDSTNLSTKLFDNPVITVKLPEGLTGGNLSSPTIVNGNGLEIENAKAEGNVITIVLKGKQTEYDLNNVSGGASIVMNIENLNFKDTLPTHEDKIKVLCEQGKEVINAECDVNIVSKSGLLILSKVSGFDEKNSALTTIDSEVKTVEIESNSEDKEIIQSLNLVNNYDEDLKEIQIIGRIGYSDEEIVSTHDVELIKPIEVKGKVYYSNNSNASYNDSTWQEEFTKDAKAYKIELEKNGIVSKDILDIKVCMKVPVNVENKEETYIKTDVNYIYDDKTFKDSSTVGLLIPAYELMMSAQNSEEELSISTKIKAGDVFIDNNAEVLEGQILKYKVRITNNTNEDKNNLKLKTTIKNAVYYELVETNEIYDLVGSTSYRYAEGLKNDFVRKIDISIPANTTKEYEYQIVVNEDVEDISSNIELTNLSGEVITNNIITNKVKASKLKLKVEYAYNEEREVCSNSTMNIALFVKNLSDEELKNVPIEIQLPTELECYSYEFYGKANIDMDYDEQSHKITTIISDIPKDTEYKIIILNKTGSIDKQLMYKKVKVVASSNLDNISYISNELIKDIKQVGSNLNITLNDDFNNKEVKDKDIINYVFEITNSGILDYENANVYANFDSGVKLLNSQIIYKDGKVEEIDISNNIISKELTVSKNDNITIKCQVEINADTFEVGEEELQNEFSISNGLGIVLKEVSKLTISAESINNGREETPEYGDDKNEPSDTPVDKEESDTPADKPNNTEDNKEQDNNQEETPKLETYTISGVAWIDENKNGQKDTRDNVKEGIEVSLVDVKIGNFALDANGDRIKTITDSEGNYTFNNIEKGTYIILFEFDTNIYTVTTYQKEKVSADINSDVILSNVNIDGNDKIAALTDKIELNSNKNNIDIGLMKNIKFDLSLNKQITKIDVINPKGTETYEYEDGETAKVDLVAKYMNNTNVVVTYKFTVQNEGDIAGYVDSLVDNLPTGLEFSSELNNDWYRGSDGKLYTTALSGIAIEPGKSVEIELVLTKKMTEENAGIFPNSAKLEKISNLQNIQETEASIENNNSSATLIISIKTGTAIMYIGITALCLMIIGIGTYFVKKKVLRNVI